MKTSRIYKQKQAIQAMIKLYCRKNHHTKNELCHDCMELLNYANARLDHCRYGENKHNCEKCKTHCYKKDMREKILKVMRFSGPIIIIYNPKIALEHLTDKFKYNKKTLTK